MHAYICWDKCIYIYIYNESERIKTRKRERKRERGVLPDQEAFIPFIGLDS